MSDLATKRCEPCTAGTPPLGDADLERLMPQLPGWSVTATAAEAGAPGTPAAPATVPKAGARRIEKEYRFADFRQALAFVNRVGEIAEAEGHHPDLELGWGRVKITLWTHSIGGISESDLILAAKADRARSI
jgi:4a-hydroxytetrahydrobiopterin dehydratase